ncbi:MAG: ATP-binding protein [Desulfobacula sp.]|nr:ATP-binding protein [Desulfobacula sp.]
MLPKNNLQKKLLSSVFIIVTLIIIAVTAMVTMFERHRYQQMELKGIYYETRAIKKRLGHLMFGSNWRYVMITLSNAKLANPYILYFSLTDMNRKILVSDDESLIGKTTFTTATVKTMSAPLFETSQREIMDTISSRFEIYQAQLNKDIIKEGVLRASKDEMIFDAYWDISYLGEKLGRLRVGFSKEGLKQHLVFLIGAMLGTSFFVLGITLLLIFWRVRLELKPLKEFTNQLSVFYSADTSSTLRQNLQTIHLEKLDSDLEEVQKLKRAFSKLRDRFILNWDQLETHRNNLEETVAQRTLELNRLNSKLVSQIEERNQIETRLINVQKLEAIGTLAGGIAHEFNNLFMAIIGYASLIQKQVEPGHPNAVKAEKIRDLVGTGSESIKQLLGFARSGKYAPGLLNLNEIIRINLAMFNRTRKDLEVVSKFEQDIWSVFADRSQMEHIVMNLLINASEAMPESGRIIVESQNIVLHKKQIRMDKVVSGRFVKVSVADEGQGIEKELIPRIFDPFFTTKPMSAGTGLGLASVYGIVDNHNGFTTVESTVAKGTVFNIFLPVAEQKK